MGPDQQNLRKMGVYIKAKEFEQNYSLFSYVAVHLPTTTIHIQENIPIKYEKCYSVGTGCKPTLFIINIAYLALLQKLLFH
jgi:hypothetical protein